MKNILIAFSLFNFIFMAMASSPKEQITVPKFGNVEIYKPEVEKRGLIIFLSGDGGWNAGVSDMAKEVVPLGYWVAGVNITSYLKSTAQSKEACFYSAGDLENLSKHIQKKYNFEKYYHPILMGYSSGATLVYVAYAQAPENTFRGAISLGFCPDLNVNKVPCKGGDLKFTPLPKGHGYLFDKTPLSMANWYVLNGEKDQVCTYPEAKSFVTDVKDAHLITLPKVGHGFSVYANWMPQLKDSIAKLGTDEVPSATLPTDLTELPIVEILPEKVSSLPSNTPTWRKMVLMSASGARLATLTPYQKTNDFCP